MECESCEKRGAEVDALIDGDYKRMCKMCAQLEGAVVVERPAKGNVMDSYKRATVKEVLMRMSGIPKNKPASLQNSNLRISPIQTNRVTLGGRKMEEEYSSHDSNRVVSNFPNRVRAQQAQSPVAVQALEGQAEAQAVQPKKGFFSRLFGGRSNEPESTPSPTNGPSLPPMGGLNGTRRMANADDGVLEL